jgi:hypothetical protein
MRIFEFTGHTQLNPLLWQDQQLKPGIADALKAIADEFIKFVDLSVPVVDILITGGQASYHYNQYSDLDLHLVIDYRQIECDEEVGELLDTKRLLFKHQHSITVMGIPVEPGTEDLNNPSVSAAYSIESQQWIRAPKNHSDEIDRDSVDQQVYYWARIIKGVLNQNQPELAEKVLKLLRKYRKMGLKTTGEYGAENLAYKVLRNQQLVTQLADRVAQNTDQSLSLGS